MLNQLAAKIGDARNFQVDVGHVALFGLCAACGGHEIENDDDAVDRDIQAGTEAGCA